jgi:ATP-dependent DNA helicase RecQ
MLGDAGRIRAVYRGETKIEVRRTPPGFDAATRSGNPRTRTRNDRNAAVEALDADVRARFESLRAWRRDRASEQHVPPYVIFQDRTLLEIARREPGSLAALGDIPGVGESKIARYGTDVLAALLRSQTTGAP